MSDGYNGTFTIEWGSTTANGLERAFQLNTPFRSISDIALVGVQIDNGGTGCVALSLELATNNASDTEHVSSTALSPHALRFFANVTAAAVVTTIPPQAIPWVHIPLRSQQRPVESLRLRVRTWAGTTTNVTFDNLRLMFVTKNNAHSITQRNPMDADVLEEAGNNRGGQRLG